MCAVPPNSLSSLRTDARLVLMLGEWFWLLSRQEAFIRAVIHELGESVAIGSAAVHSPIPKRGSFKVGSSKFNDSAVAGVCAITLTSPRPELDRHSREASPTALPPRERRGRKPGKNSRDRQKNHLTHAPSLRYLPRREVKREQPTAAEQRPAAARGGGRVLTRTKYRISTPSPQTGGGVFVFGNEGRAATTHPSKQT